jgi:hypothetical protein
MDACDNNNNPPEPVKPHPSGSGSATMPSQMLPLELGFAKLQLKPAEYKCDYLDTEMISRKGCIIQYVNHNQLGAAKVIGATRTGVMDPRKVPLYLQKYKDVIKAHAVATLQTHLLDIQCSTGILESIPVEDYSISFTWASVSEEGRTLNPEGKPELPLAFAAFDNWVIPRQPCRGDLAGVYVVNAYIMLQESVRRRAAVLKKNQLDELAKAELAKRPFLQGVKSGYQGPNPNYLGNNPKNGIPAQSIQMSRTEFNNTLQAERDVAVQEHIRQEGLKRPSPSAMEEQFPAMEPTEPPIWNKSTKILLPTE